MPSGLLFDQTDNAGKAKGRLSCICLVFFGIHCTLNNKKVLACAGVGTGCLTHFLFACFLSHRTANGFTMVGNWTQLPV